jgi:hypothetical protein
MQHFRLPMGFSPVLDWLLGSGCLQPHISLRTVYLFSRRTPCSEILPAARLASMCLGGVEWKKSPGLQKFGDICSSAPRQSQAFLLSVDADDKCYFSYELSSLVVESPALFGHRLIFIVVVAYLNFLVNLCSAPRHTLCGGVYFFLWLYIYSILACSKKWHFHI